MPQHPPIRRETPIGRAPIAATSLKRHPIDSCSDENVFVPEPGHNETRERPKKDAILHDFTAPSAWRPDYVT